MAKKKASKKKATRKVSELKPITPQDIWIEKKKAFLKGRQNYVNESVKAADKK